MAEQRFFFILKETHEVSSTSVPLAYGLGTGESKRETLAALFPSYLSLSRFVFVAVHAQNKFRLWEKKRKTDVTKQYRLPSSRDQAVR